MIFTATAYNNARFSNDRAFFAYLIMLFERTQ